jgi:hypothetical protein
VIFKAWRLAKVATRSSGLALCGFFICELLPRSAWYYAMRLII